MPDEFGYDVFISYSSEDKAWVRGELLQSIEQTGLKAFIDFRDFARGAPSIKECERGVEKCRKTLLILTPDYLESEWCEFEGIIAQTLSPANRDLRIIPLLKDKCKKPPRIGMLTHVDFTDDADHDLAWRQLLTALGAPPEPEPLPEPQRDGWFLAHPYLMPPNFTGRDAERTMLTDWLNTDARHPLLSLRALGGFGKSALVWHWLMHNVEPTDWPRVVWWSFYETDARFDNFLVMTLEYLSGGKIHSDSLSARDAIDELLNMLHQPGTLLVLDGFERGLRAFGGMNAAYQGDEGQTEDNERDCISPLAEEFLRKLATLPEIRSKIMLTTRLCPRVLEVRGGGFLEGCREEELTQMEPADAVAYFVAQGIRGTRAEIEAVCEPYGYHPLSLCLLAGLIVGDLQQPGDISAASELDVSGDLVQRQHHVLEVAYTSFPEKRQALLSRIACFRSPVKYEALKVLAETEEGEGASGETPDANLRDLVARGLLHHDKNTGRFDLHPIVRRYAYDRLAAPDRTDTHAQLRDYFSAVPAPEKVERLDDLAPVIELYHHTVKAGQFEEAWVLSRDRIIRATFYQFGAYQLCIELLRALFPDGEDRPPRVKDESAQGWILNELAGSYSFSGQPLRVVPLFERANEIYENQTKNKGHLAVGLSSMATVALLPLGMLRAADTNLRRQIALSREIEDGFKEAVGHREMGRLLAYRGAYTKSEKELSVALKLFEKQAEIQSLGIVQAYHTQLDLFQLRTNPDATHSTLQSALESARRALEFADETTRTIHPVERDYIDAHWVLGAAHCVADQHEAAESHLHEALERCRRINLVEMEADILINLARLRVATGLPDEAKQLAEEALVITERCGYVLQGADAHLELAKLALADGDKETALEHAKQARSLATCDGPPDYTYKVAYDEAGALMTELGEAVEE